MKHAPLDVDPSFPFAFTPLQLDFGGQVFHKLLDALDNG
jgi:hypothetical protein